MEIVASITLILLMLLAASVIIYIDVMPCEKFNDKDVDVDIITLDKSILPYERG